MKKVMFMSVMVFTLFFGMQKGLWAQSRLRSSGIVLRGSFWGVDDDYSVVSVRDGYRTSEVSTGFAGGWIGLFSRIGEKSYFELNIGAIGQVGVNTVYSDGDEVDVKGAMPVAAGIRYHILAPDHPNAFQPYVSAGGGPYWLGTVHVWDDWGNDSEVDVRSRMHLGLYGGAGVYFHCASWFALNLDMKYHLIDMNFSHDYSGLEFGFGFAFLWGSYNR